MPDLVQLRLSGGEPTLHPDFFSLLDFATAYDAAVTIFTNGRWRHPEKFIEQITQHANANLTGLLVSLHGADAQSHEKFTGVPGSFEETCANIRMAVDSGFVVTLSNIITHKSWNQIEQVLSLAQTLGVQSIAFNRYLGAPLPGIEPTIEEMRAAQVTIDRLIADGAPVKYGIGVPQCFAMNSSGGCLAGVAYATIDPWGNLRPCNHSPTVIGSLFENSMHELWHSDKMNAWRALIPEECTTCVAYSVCHGGCRAIQELRADGRDPLRREPLAEYAPPQEIKEIPADVCPIPNFRMREEPFGYILLGRGQVIPIAREAKLLLAACDGETSFAQLAERFGQSGLDLFGELWEKGLLSPP
jgi:radical SAM protein with 4Fe4S-binding SPASM domain